MREAMRPLSFHRKRLYGRVYSIGIYTGPSPLALSPPDHRIRNPVLTRESVTDLLATFVADPFMIRVDGLWHMFFEALTWRVHSKKGEVAHATSKDGFDWQYQGVVLVEPFHLSYPYVFQHRSDHYMIPESAEAGAIRLYRADPFPRRWVWVTDLVTGPEYRDNCVFQHDGRWWMFTHTSTDQGTLRLFHAPELTGAWVEHPRSPVVAADRRIARPAGRIVSMDGRLLRFAQDCRVTYGASVAAFEIARLTPDAYEEIEFAGNPILTGGEPRWNRGMHHLDPHQLEDGTWIACVDKWTNRLRRPREIARWALDRWFNPRVSPDSDPA
jgi:hypothetical protein